MRTTAILGMQKRVIARMALLVLVVMLFIATAVPALAGGRVKYARILVPGPGSLIAPAIPTTLMLHGDFKVEDGKVWVNWMEAKSPISGPGVEVQTTWSGVVTQGGSYAEIGVNWQIRQEVPTPWGGMKILTTSPYHRIRVHADGRVGSAPWGTPVFHHWR